MMLKSGLVVAERYHIKSLIGSGGMQDVYLAQDALVGREIALKTPQAGQKVKRFRDSAVIAARVNHHNIAKTYDYVPDEEQPFLIEEYVPGRTLEDATIGSIEAIDPHMGAFMFGCLAHGVAASHQAGVVHRDLKPSNILVSADPNFRFLKITDFGIATLAGEVFEEAVRSGDLTKSTSGTVRGALPYMAPEMMFRRPGEHPGPASDVWSLGALMFRVLTGEYPHGVGFEAAANLKNKDRAPWPKFMTAKPQFAPLASELQKIVDVCMEYDPTARPSAQALATRLRSLCFFSGPRELGVVESTKFNGSYGQIRSTKRELIFIHSDSLYGAPRLKEKQKVIFSRHKGNPLERAHPVILLK